MASRRVRRRRNGRNRQRRLLGALRALAATRLRLHPSQSMASRGTACPGSEEQSMNQDLYAETTARIVAALERGAAPWVRPWSQIADAIPVNAQTRRPYRGINFTLLSLEAQARGFAVNRWLTYRHAQELG